MGEGKNMSQTTFGSTKFVIASGRIAKVKIVDYINNQGEPAQLLDFSLVVDYNSKKGADGKWVPESVEWISVVSPATEFNKKFHRKGAIVSVSGVENHRIYEKKDGTTGVNVEIKNANIAILKNAEAEDNPAGNEDGNSDYNDFAPPNNMGDIPF